MIFQRFGDLGVVVLMVTTLTMVINTNWRRGLAALAIQYAAVFWLTASVWPVGLAVVKLVVGWMVTAVLGASQPEDVLKDPSTTSISGFVFRILSVGIVWLVIFSVSPDVNEFIPTYPALLMGSLMLIGVGLLQMGITTKPFRVLIGLLTALSGFEVVYSALEPSVLVAGLLAVVNLGLALVGAYWMLPVGKPEEVE